MGEFRKYWAIGDVPRFNHGSFGATPTAVLEKQAQYLAAFNADREALFWGGGLERHQAIRTNIAEFAGADADDLVIVDNATEGVNTVLKSLSFNPGDEILITDHIYTPYQSVLKELEHRTGAKVVTVEIPLPVTGPDAITAAVMDGVTDKTKLAFIDHVTSPTALIMPVADIVAKLAERGIDCFIDGAHAPGQVKLDLNALGAAYYTGNHHKWICAPVQSGFLHVRRDRQGPVIPAVGSFGSGRDTPFAERFIWQGTRDCSARFCVPDTIDYMAGLMAGGWDEIIRRNHDTAIAARDMLLDATGAPRNCPDDMVGCMFTLSLGVLDLPPDITALLEHLQVNTLMKQRFGYSIYAHWHHDHWLARVSCPLYNDVADYEPLAADLSALLTDMAA